MYTYTKDIKFAANNTYYSYSNNEYTPLVAGTDYTVGDSIPANSVYSYYKYNMMYIKAENGDYYYEFPYVVNNTSAVPPHDVSANDVDVDSYTNTEGKAVRNRVRENVPSVDFNVPVMSGDELHKLFQYSETVWCKCYFFYEPKWNFTEEKMYRSGTVKYTRYYMDENNPLLNIYKDIQFSFVGE